MKIYVVYDSEGDHTKALAEAIAAGAGEAEQAEVFIDHVKDADIRKLDQMDAIIWGCPGHFGTISSGLKTWIDRLGYLWAEGKLIDKVGAVFCTTATTHGGLEMTMHNLITPMFHQGMLVVGLPGNVPENALYGSYYGAGVTCPIDSDEVISAEGIELGKALGRRVASVTASFKR
ncbi:NAD(P)H-dependent oxidoreductase [Bacillus altitudinis]|uniref:NAD(P)H-dependent oxidoreductase n=1 Tax=Bacillus TaxID=1386 RepID=UPI000DBBE1D3|nr:NAD(P)H-dependent oxidoreductase [Bacillus altitudinis]KAJ0072348.1 NAD(P)H-dependent oxidoreductase [Bacillus altitudinis]MCW4357870.1 NAD(P)H-dependent oxidoreductase [Bacillus altitudinis]QSI45385.1 NAD(P)H-dependent oxidoreductase [Bacillus altitudinis]WJE31261.1 NAD(P)H-dependent oxidoreductase [Bacillus altitudinis]SPR95018.1 NADH:quinone oxidoreductase associated to benzoate stress [Bacillus altitudinis]